jgi:hypothetical protein
MTLNSGSFKKGHDPRRFIANQKPVTEYREELRGKLASGCAYAANFIIGTMKDKEAPLKLRLIAARDVLDRVGGSAVNQVNINMVSSEKEVDLSTLSTPELERMVLKFASEDGEILEGEVVEVEQPTYTDSDAKNSLKQSGID